MRNIITVFVKASLLVVTVFSVTACSSLPEVITGSANHYPGYRHYDPCIRCGESWIVVPNAPMAALQKSRQNSAQTEINSQKR